MVSMRATVWGRLASPFGYTIVWLYHSVRMDGSSAAGGTLLSISCIYYIMAVEFVTQNQ
jgi:hypothetical protein